MAKLVDIARVFQGLARAGRGVGTRRGDWLLQVVESGDIQEDGWLNPCALRTIELAASSKVERYLLRPYDVLITARTGSVQLALVPPWVSRTVAGVTLLVVRPREPESGMGHYLWYFLTSVYGRSQLVKRLTVNTTITTLSARAAAEVEVPWPSPSKLDLVVRLVEESEAAFISAVQAARLRRETVRDSVIREIVAESADKQG